jgi:signal transduction histidine kinase
LPTDADTQDTRYVYFAIQDSGPGIGGEHLDHIFEPFYSTKKMGHSGSGLAIKKCLAQPDKE